MKAAHLNVAATKVGQARPHPHGSSRGACDRHEMETGMQLRRVLWRPISGEKRRLNQG